MGPIGTLVAYGPNSGPLSAASSPEHMEGLLCGMADLMKEHCVAQKEVQDLTEQLTQSFEDLYLYSRIGPKIKTLQFSARMLRDLCGEILDTMRVDLAFAELPARPAVSVLVSAEGLSEKAPDMEELVAKLLKNIPKDASSLEEGYFIVNDSTLHTEYAGLYALPYRFLAVKMQHNDEFYGWLGMVSFNLREIFRRSELKLLNAVSEQIAVVIANTDLYRDLERFVINVVRSLVNAIEAKDVYTRGHSERVNRYSMLIAKRLGMQGESENYLHWASILHDIGKIAIPEGVLNKPTHLDDPEYELVKRHPEKGHEILGPIEQLIGSLPGILHHHERYDGKGYPQGIKGEEIPLIARIVSVADTFDAITSDRAYRKARTPQEALRIMEAVAGTQLDPGLFEIFKDVCNEELGVGKGATYGR
jgi:HD-GYP domain-containing protein (c-di-GMP phosphodiesterase class II)